MKQKSENKFRAFSLIEILVVIAILAILAAIALPNLFHAKAATDTQGLPQSIISPSGCPTNIAAGQTSNNLTAPIILRKGQGLGLSWTYNGSTNVTLVITASVDGTNYFAFCTLAQTNALALVQSNNFATLGTNFSIANLAGIYSLNILSMGNLGTIALSNQVPTAPITVNRPNG